MMKIKAAVNEAKMVGAIRSFLPLSISSGRSVASTSSNGLVSSVVDVDISSFNNWRGDPKDLCV